MKAVRILVKAANALLSAAAVLFLITAGSYSAYALLGTTLRSIPPQTT